MADPQYEKGAPSVMPGEQQKPQGEATALNAAAQDITPPEGVTFAKPPRAPQGALAGNDAILAGPTDRPGEPVTRRSAQSVAVPEEVIAASAAIVEAGQDINAAPAVKALVRLLDQHING